MDTQIKRPLRSFFTTVLDPDPYESVSFWPRVAKKSAKIMGNSNKKSTKTNKKCLKWHFCLMHNAHIYLALKYQKKKRKNWSIIFLIEQKVSLDFSSNQDYSRNGSENGIETDPKHLFSQYADPRICKSSAALRIRIWIQGTHQNSFIQDVIDLTDYTSIIPNLMENFIVKLGWKAS